MNLLPDATLSPHDATAWMHHSEDALLRMAQAGDDVAFGALMLKLDAPVRRFVRRLLGASDAEDDIVQDAFFKLHRKLSRIEPEQGLRPYLFRIVRNCAYDELRTLRHYDTVSLDDEPIETYASFQHVSDNANSPEETAHWLLIQLEVQAAMDKLPELQRQTLILYSEEGLSYGEIAEVMNTTLGTIKSRLFHARKTLRQLLRPELLEALADEFGDNAPRKQTQ